MSIGSKTKTAESTDYKYDQVAGTPNSDTCSQPLSSQNGLTDILKSGLVMGDVARLDAPRERAVRGVRGAALAL